MEITIWCFFAVLIWQAVCFPSFESQSGSTSDNAGKHKQFFEDFQNFVKKEGISQDNEGVKKMLHGLLVGDVDQESNDHHIEAIKKLQLSSADSTQQPSPTAEPQVPDFNGWPPSDLSQPQNLDGDIKSLAEWVRIDRERDARRRMRLPNNPSTENSIQEPSSSYSDYLDEEFVGNNAEPPSTPEDHLVKSDQLLKSPYLETPPVANEVTEKSTYGVDQFPMYGIGSHKSIYDNKPLWRPEQKPSISKEEEEDPEEETSFTDMVFSKLASLKHYISNPFSDR